MPSIEAIVHLRQNGQDLPGFPVRGRLEADEVVQHREADIASGGTFSAADAVSGLTSAKVVFVRAVDVHQKIRALINSNNAKASPADTGLLDQGGFILVFGGDLDSNDLLSIANDDTSDRHVDVLAAGT